MQHENEYRKEPRKTKKTLNNFAGIRQSPGNLRRLRRYNRWSEARYRNWRP